jgi:hypothetical protein
LKTKRIKAAELKRGDVIVRDALLFPVVTVTPNFDSEHRIKVECKTGGRWLLYPDSEIDIRE